MPPNSWCRNLSNKVRLIQRHDGDLGYQPCCWMVDTIPVSTKDDLTQARQQFEDLVMNDREKYCSECIRRENIGKYLSHRQMAINSVPDDADSEDVNVLELQIDTVCNAACVICGPDFSSLWRKQLKISETDITNDYEKLYRMIKLDKITRIRFLGGEPMLSNDYLRLLDHIPNPENITIQYTTNGSIFPNADTIQTWSRYRRIIIMFSIDDMYDRFGYVRWPLRWNKIDQNFRYVLNNLKKSLIGINCTVNAMSVYYIDQLQAWSDQCGNPTLKFSKCFGTWGLSACPVSVRSQVQQKLGPAHEVSIMLDQEPWDQQYTRALVEHMDQLDAQRGTDWRKTFADIQHYF